MNPLLDNPIGEMSGPAFLALYATVAVGCIFWAYFRARAADDTERLDVPELPAEFDPFEIAYLRGGTPEWVRMMIFDLITRGYLESHEVAGFLGIGTRTRKIRIARGHPPVQYLEPAERVVFDWMVSDKEVSGIFPGLGDRLKENRQNLLHREHLEARDLLTSAGRGAAIARAKVAPLLVLGGLAGYKLFAAFAHGRFNVFFLIALAIFSGALVFGVSQPKRLTALGRKYFARLQEALGMLKDRAPALVAGQANDHLLLAVAAFGINALERTQYSYYPAMFKKAATKDGGGCGSGCGSFSSGGGSSCGSSCGGGGGCGGGCGGCGS